MIKRIKNERIIKSKLIAFFLLSFLFVPKVFAASGTYTSSGGSVYVGNSFDVYVSVNTNGDIQAVAGRVGVSDSSCISINSVTPIVGDTNGDKFAYVANGSIPSGTNIVNVNVTGLKPCQASLIISEAVVTSTQEGDIQAGVSMGTIYVNNPPSGNNNLSSLSVSQGSINFDKNVTNYNISVGADVSSINIEANKEDSTASISGTGNKSLNYGNNRFDIVVTAENGSSKTYTINVNRQDNRSGNVNLGSLTISDGELSPGFNANTDSYNVSVPYSVEHLNINATAADSKSSVSIQNNNLTAEETTEVKIYVTAENGATKTYTIYAKRGKDPNKVLSTVKYLTSITTSTGVLSPAFNKEQYEYIVYVPYEVESINIDVALEDTRYGVLTKEGPEKLSVGNNEYKYTVMAEDESTQVYKVIVSRGISLTEQNLSDNNNLSKIEIKNGTLKEVFDKNTVVYHYTRKKDFSIEAISEDEKSEVNIIDNEDVIYILVKSEMGNLKIYSLLKETKKLDVIHFILIGLIVVFFIIGFVLGKILKNFKFKNKKIKEIKKENIENE